MLFSQSSPTIVDYSDVVDLIGDDRPDTSWRELLAITVVGVLIFGLFWWNTPEGRAFRSLDITESEYRELVMANRIEEVWIGPAWVTARLNYPLVRAGGRHRMVTVKAIFANVQPDLQLWAPSLESSKVHITK